MKPEVFFSMYKTGKKLVELQIRELDYLRQWLSADRWFSPGTLVSTTNKTGHHDITEMPVLLKVALNIITITLYMLRQWKWMSYKSGSLYLLLFRTRQLIFVHDIKDLNVLFKHYRYLLNVLFKHYRYLLNVLFKHYLYLLNVLFKHYLYLLNVLFKHYRYLLVLLFFTLFTWCKVLLTQSF